MSEDTWIQNFLLIVQGQHERWIATSIHDDDDDDDDYGNHRDQIMIRIIVRSCHTTLSIQRQRRKQQQQQNVSFIRLNMWRATWV